MKLEKCTEELWKDIPELNGRYQCSNKGRVRRVNKDPRCKKYRYLKTTINSSGYYSVNPTRSYRKMVHRIVAELFLDKVDGKNYVNHKDLNKLNNDVSNLEWVTKSENSKHAKDYGRLGVICHTVWDNITNMFFDSLREAADYYGYPYRYTAKIAKQNGFYKNLFLINKQYKKFKPLHQQ